VLTTGGTGPARRDVTPEATLAVGTKEMPGFGEQMRQISLHFVPTAILSRQVAVIRETDDHAALIMNLPGQPKSIKETLEGLKDADGRSIVGGIFAAVPYCIDLIGGPYIDTNPAVTTAWRPKSAQRPATVPTEGQRMSELLEHITDRNRDNPDGRRHLAARPGRGRQRLRADGARTGPGRPARHPLRLPACKTRCR
jgi:hypothetical protein